jgi:hypothetical protein
MIEHFNLQNLTGANQVARDFDISFRRGRIPAGMVVLCGAPVYVQRECRHTLMNTVCPVSFAAHNQSPESHERMSGVFCHERPRFPCFGISFSADWSVLRFISRSIST